jgi:N-methylhydantoinase A
MVVPLSDLASGWSAFGVAGSEALIVEQTAVSLLAPFDPEELNEHWAQLEARVRDRIVAQGIDADGIRFSRLVDMRYPLQVNQIPVPAPAGAYDDALVEGLVANYEREYARLFGEGTGYAEAGYAMTGMRVEGRADISDFRLAERSRADATASSTGRRVVTFVDGSDIHQQEADIYDGPSLGVAAQIAGPAVAEFPNTSVVIPQGATAEVDGFGSLVLHV